MQQHAHALLPSQILPNPCYSIAVVDEMCRMLPATVMQYTKVTQDAAECCKPSKTYLSATIVLKLLTLSISAVTFMPELPGMLQEAQKQHT